MSDNFFKVRIEERDIKLKMLYLLFFFIFLIPSISAIGISNPKIPIVDNPSPIITFNNNSGSVNSSDYWDGYNTPADIPISLLPNDVGYINGSYANSTYLKLDASNDPITSDLDIKGILTVTPTGLFANATSVIRMRPTDQVATNDIRFLDGVGNWLLSLGTDFNGLNQRNMYFYDIVSQVTHIYIDENNDTGIGEVQVDANGRITSAGIYYNSTLNGAVIQNLTAKNYLKVGENTQNYTAIYHNNIDTHIAPTLGFIYFDLPAAKTIVAKGQAQVVGSSRSTASYYDNRSIAAGIGGGFGLGGTYQTTNNQQTVFAAVWSEKENAINGDYGGNLVMGARVNGSTISKDMILYNSGILNVTRNNLNVQGNISVRGYVGITQVIQIVKDVDLVGLTKTYCNISIVGGIINGTSC